LFKLFCVAKEAEGILSQHAITTLAATSTDA